MPQLVDQMAQKRPIQLPRHLPAQSKPCPSSSYGECRWPKTDTLRTTKTDSGKEEGAGATYSYKVRLWTTLWLWKKSAVCVFFDYRAATGGALAPRETQCHQVSVRPRSSWNIAGWLILLIFICALDTVVTRWLWRRHHSQFRFLDSVFSRCSDPDDGITLNLVFASYILVMQTTPGSWAGTLERNWLTHMAGPTQQANGPESHICHTWCGTCTMREFRQSRHMPRDTNGDVHCMERGWSYN